MIAARRPAGRLNLHRLSARNSVAASDLPGVGICVYLDDALHWPNLRAGRQERTDRVRSTVKD